MVLKPGDIFRTGDFMLHCAIIMRNRFWDSLNILHKEKADI